jgi:hypothetical protein
MEQLLMKKLGVFRMDRKKLKAAIFQVLFTDNRFIGQKEAAPKRIFRDAFPNVYELFRLLKLKESSNLPRLLQRIESHLILKVITKSIARQNPKVPIFTIHDSIITTTGYEGFVKDILNEEMKRAISWPPNVSIETWQPQKAKEFSQVNLSSPDKAA